IIRQPADRLNRVALPALALRDDGTAFVIAKVDDDKVLVHDLEQQRPVVLSREDFLDRYQGRLLTVASRASLVAELARFDFSWFIPAMVQYRTLLLEVVVDCFFMHLSSLILTRFITV